MGNDRPPPTGRLFANYLSREADAVRDLLPSSVPQGWYLTGVVVAEQFRRRGIGLRLTRERLRWISQRAPEAYYFANSLNVASIELHRPIGFEELQRDFHFPNTHFSGGVVGVLFRICLLKRAAFTVGH